MQIQGNKTQLNATAGTKKGFQDSMICQKGFKVSRFYNIQKVIRRVALKIID